VTPSKGVEITAITTYPRPSAWGAFGTPAGDRAELAALGANAWYPTTEYFQIVGNTPNEKKAGMTELKRVETLKDLLDFIIGKRAKNSVARLNIIGHGTGGLIGLKGTVVPAGGVGPDGTPQPRGNVFFEPALHGTTDDLTPLQTNSIDQFVVSWLAEEREPNHPDDPSEVERTRLRDAARSVFLPDALIVLFLCKSASGLSIVMTRDLAKAFHVNVGAWREEIGYHVNPDGPPARGGIDRKNIKTSTLTTDAQGNITSGPKGKGYPCFVPVDPALAGDHMRGSMVTQSKPAKPSP
jgi:hypothetical protein